MTKIMDSLTFDEYISSQKKTSGKIIGRNNAHHSELL